MSKPTVQTVQRIKDAAKRRVDGQSWSAIAERYGYKDAHAACNVLTGEHPDEWRKAYEKERTLWLDELEAAAGQTQRELLTSEDDRVRQSAAHSLLHHCRQLRAHKIEVKGDLTHRSTTDLIEAARRGGFGTAALAAIPTEDTPK